MQNQITRYTPSLMSQEELESIFVQRQTLLDTLFERHKDSVLTASKYFSLLIAPRGMGKTHLVSMLNNQLKADTEVASNMMLAWLREEEWGISSYQDLLSQIIKCLQQDYGLDENALFDQLYLMDECDAHMALESLLFEILGDKSLILIAENLNIIFDSIQTEGQEKLRALIQNSGKISIIAAAQSLFSGVTTRKGPFYGFFTNYHLQKLNFEDALQLLKNIAARNGNDSLLEMLDTERGRARVRALHHLASGSPRIYVMFSQFIQADNLDEFTGPVLQMLDELTPYYQAKMLELPAQQRKLVITLCREQGAITVQDLAKKCHITQQTASSQLKKLKDNGFVESSQYGRQSYYEIAEPLMRMVLSIKEQRGGAVKLAIDIIRHFFTISEMKNIVEQPEVNVLGLKLLTKDLLEKAINVKEPNPYITVTIKSFEEAILKNKVSDANQILREYFGNHELSGEYFSVWENSIEKLMKVDNILRNVSLIEDATEGIEELGQTSAFLVFLLIKNVHGVRFKKHSSKNKYISKLVSKLSHNDKVGVFTVLLIESSSTPCILDAIAEFDLITAENLQIFIQILSDGKQTVSYKNEILTPLVQWLSQKPPLSGGMLSLIILLLRIEKLIDNQQFLSLLNEGGLQKVDYSILVMGFIMKKSLDDLEILSRVFSDKSYNDPLNLLTGTAIKYFQTNDSHYLLDLPKEHRGFLEKIDELRTRNIFN